MRAGAAGVDRQVDQHRDEHAHQSGRERQHEPAALTQVTEIELAARLQPHHQEE